MLRTLGPHTITDLQTKFGSRMFFNTLIPWESGMIKYGVISTADLLSDCLDWDTLYTAGRLHKPVRMLNPPGALTEVGFSDD